MYSIDLAKLIPRVFGFSQRQVISDIGRQVTRREFAVGNFSDRNAHESAQIRHKFR